MTLSKPSQGADGTARPLRDAWSRRPQRSLVYRAASWMWHRLPASIRATFWRSYWGRRDHTGYQRIRFRGRTFVRGTDRSRSYRQIFPSPPKGKTILDVGSWLGFYPLKALLEGAAYCRAVEKTEGFAARIGETASALRLRGLDAIQADILDYTIDRSFDVVLCLNVLHHLETMERVEQVVDKLFACTHERMCLIIQVPVDLSRPYTYDAEPTNGERWVRISPLYFIERYGANRVHVEPAKTYGGTRYLVVVTKDRP